MEAIKKILEIVSDDKRQRWEEIGFLQGIDNKEEKNLCADAFIELVNRADEVQHDDYAAVAFSLVRRAIHSLDRFDYTPKLIIDKAFEVENTLYDFLEFAEGLDDLKDVDNEAIIVGMCSSIVSSRVIHKQD